MKVLANGGLNLSELDGWWAEAYRCDVGWALGDGREHGDDSNWDAVEAEALYLILENEVIPAFYTRNAEGLSTEWLVKMRQSMVSLTARFSANRAVRQYTNECHIPLAAAYEVRRDKLPDREGGYGFTAQVPATRPAGDFTSRLTPYFSGVAVPLKITLILWHH